MMEKTPVQDDKAQTYAVVNMAIGVVINETKQALQTTAPDSPNRPYYNALLQHAYGMLEDSIADNYGGDRLAAYHAAQTLDIDAVGQEKFANDVQGIKSMMSDTVREILEAEHNRAQHSSPPTTVAPQNLLGRMTQEIRTLF